MRTHLAAASAMAKDPVCGMVVPTATALSARRGDRTDDFCSTGCRQTILAPEQEIRHIRRRVVSP
jgi:Cu+-exporting ATPase